MSWKDLVTVKKGDIGEEIIDKWLKENGYMLYKPNFDGSHPFDRLVLPPDNPQIFVVEVKTKARRNHYPDTGFDEKHYNKYKFVMEKYKIPIRLMFVDEMEKKVYGNYLNILDQKKEILWHGKTIIYPFHDKGIVYFPLESMITYFTLDDAVVQKIKDYNTRSPSYDYLKEKQYKL